jgi:thiol-disulfide isomerase/thioredoxin
MTVDASRPSPTGSTAPGEPRPARAISTAPGRASSADRGPGIVIDPRVMFVGGAVALIGVMVLGLFLWMVPSAADREGEAACRGLKSGLDAENIALCPAGNCQLPVVAPDFTAKDINGKDVKLSDYRGRVVLLNFWASWCGVCKTEKPALNAMASEMAGDDFVVISLASDHKWEAALTAVLESLVPGAVAKEEPTMASVSTAFRQSLPNGTAFKVLLDPPAGDDNIGRIATAWGVKKVPDSALIDRRGNIRAYFVNKREWHSPVAQTCLRSVIDGE